MDSDAEILAYNKQYLEDLAEEIRNTQPYGSDITDRRWLEDNKEKILRNKRLINLLG